jgi:hypothetical protein
MQQPVLNHPLQIFHMKKKVTIFTSFMQVWTGSLNDIQGVLGETAAMRNLAAEFHINRNSVTKIIGTAVCCNNATSVWFTAPQPMSRLIVRNSLERWRLNLTRERNVTLLKLLSSQEL